MNQWDNPTTPTTAPDYFDKSIWGNDDDEPENYVFEHNTKVDFEIKTARLIMKNYSSKTIQKQEMVAWFFEMECTANGKTSTVRHEVYIDGRLMKELDRNQKLWVQAKIKDICKAVSLRKSKCNELINPDAYREPSLFIGKRGMAKLEYDANEGYEPCNKFNWFQSPSHTQKEHNESL